MIKTPISGIYEIVNTVNGKRYIGSTSRLSVRFLQHRSKLRQGNHDNSFLQAAWCKHGEASFVYRPIELCAKDQLLIVEQRWLNLIHNNGERHYNIAPFASSGAKGRTPSDATRAKQSASVKATYAARSPEAAAQHAEAIKARFTPEYLQAMSEKRKAAWVALSDERKAEIKAARRAGANRPESIAKQLAGTRALFQDPEFVKKQRAASAKAARKPETRAKQAANLSLRNKERWVDPVYAEKMTAIIRVTSTSKESRKRRSDSIKARWADPITAAKLRKDMQAGRDKKKVGR